ncbi:MAG TPA: hypothetical protein VLI65_10910, partial [Pyrinomonadaceae bacterium]|nr:hypothetical protein [Pyrinomonadaceae bacterium]
MFKPAISKTIFISTLAIASVCGACSRSAPYQTANAAPAANTATMPSAQNSGIEVEVITTRPLEGSITATGKVLATDDGTASIGPVHEGRIVRLYAGQGS